MRKITAYKVIASKSYEQFNAIAQASINDGWQPYGKPIFGGSPMQLVQAFVKFES